ALDSPFARESGYILACETSTGASVTAPGPAVRLAGSRSLTDPAPELARDLESVMAEIGIEGEELAALRDAGVV
ncbi:MAG: CoA transferase, partial [bacterium]|nr:CoA transferase [bacterium]